jgi:hypothetical protein
MGCYVEQPMLTPIGRTRSARGAGDDRRGGTGDDRRGGTGDAGRKIKVRFRESGHAAGAGALESGGLEPGTAG